MPCGERSSSTSLLITNLDDFLPDQEKGEFFAWLKSYDWRQVTESERIAAGWFRRNRQLIERQDWGSLCLPRHLFGKYMKEKVVEAFASARLESKASIATIAGEAVDVLKQENLYSVTVETKSSSHSLCAPAVVLAVGSPPYSSLATFSSEDNAKDTAIIDDPYSPSLSHNLTNIGRALGRTKRGSRNVLIVGSNATALEILYHLARDERIDAKIERVVAISRGGLLPHRAPARTEGRRTLKNLSNLQRTEKFDAEDLFGAIQKDLGADRGQDSTYASIVDALTCLVPKLISRLPEDQQLKFQNTWGMEFTKLIRRAGSEYSDAADDLLASGKLSLCTGELVRLERVRDSSIYAHYASSEHATLKHPTRFSVVVNCRGFERPNRSSASKIISSLVAQGICRVNSSGRGFQVNENLEASDKFYVLGPLLAGIHTPKLKGWHLETARRIYPAAAMLAGTLVQRL